MGFSQTCHKLSQFLKERRSHGDFGFPTTSKLDFNGGKEICGASTMNLFPMNNNMEEKERNASKGVESFKSWDFSPLMSSPTGVSSEVSFKNLCENRELPTNNGEATTSSMTIFYGGKVLVLDDLPENKALEIMSLASQGMSDSPAQAQAQTRVSNNHTCMEAQFAQGAILQAQQNLSDLPIARRVSLHRFMEKRKERIAGNTPYPLHHSSRLKFIEDIVDEESEMKKFELNLFK